MALTTQVHLTDKELISLRQCFELRPKVEAAARLAEERTAWALNNPDMSEREVRFMIDLRQVAREDGKLLGRRKRAVHCGVCGWAGKSYQKRRGSSKWHTEERSCWDFKDSFVSFVGYTHTGCCDQCYQRLKPAIRRAMVDLPVQLPAWLHELKDERWTRRDLKRCTACEWQGHEGQLGLLPALMRGKYHGKCPECGAENAPFGKRIIETTDGFIMIRGEGT